MTNQTKELEKSFFHLVAALVIYKKDDSQKQRHMNIMLETQVPHVLGTDLNQVNLGAVQRITAENDVDSDDVLDIVILNVSLLAHTDRNSFYGIEKEPAPETEH